MAFDINPIQFNFKAGRTTPPEPFVWQPAHTPRSGPWITPEENWVRIVRTGATDREYDAIIDENQAALLSTGNHTCRVKFRYKARIVGIITRTVEEFLTIKLTVTETIDLAVSPSFLAFSYTIGQNQPANKFLSLITENNWSILKDQSWLTINRTSGNASTDLSIGVDPSGLTAAIYNGQLLIDDGYNKKTVNVTLSVLGENTADDFLVATPSSLEVVETYQEPPTKTRKVVVESSESFAISADVPWISFPSANYPEGKHSILVRIINTEALNFGTHQATITVESNYSVSTVQLLLIINESVLEGVESGMLYFADDRNEISFSNSVANSELFLQYITKSATDQLTYDKTVSFFRGVANSLLGQEAKNLISSFPFLDDLSTRCFVPVQALDMKISVFDKIANTTQQTLRTTLTDVKVLTGKTPVKENWLSYIPDTITTSKSAVIVFNFMSELPPTEIRLTGSVTASFQTAEVANGIYSCMVDLSQLSVDTGDVVKIQCSGLTVAVNIGETEPEHVKIAWLNEWNCPEIFTCSGNLVIVNETDQQTASYARRGKEVTEVIEVDTPQKFDVYTGFIYTRQEVVWLQSILKARKIWIEVDGQFVPVIRKFKSLPFYETRNFLDAYKLTFESAEV